MNAHQTVPARSTVSPSVAVTSTIGWARSRDLASVGRPKLDVLACGSVGGEVGSSRFRVRLEARDYLPPLGRGSTRMSNEVALTAGVRWVRR